MFVPGKCSQPRVMFEGKARAYPSEPAFNSRPYLQTLDPGWKSLPGGKHSSLLRTYVNYYCIEGTERRQLAFRSADVYCQNINNPKCTLALFLYANRKKEKQANSKRDIERESASV